MPRKIGRFNFDSVMKTEWSEGFHAWQSVITKYYQVLMGGRQIIVDRFNALWCASLANCSSSQRAEITWDIPRYSGREYCHRSILLLAQFDPAHGRIELKGTMTMEVSEMMELKRHVAMAYYGITKPIKRRNASKPPLSRIPSKRGVKIL